MNEARKALEAAPNAWRETLEALDTVDRLKLEHELCAIAQRASLLAVYVAHRFNTGCGDQGHDRSAKRANAALAKVRAALGYSYPKALPILIP